MSTAAAELNLRILWSLARWVEDTVGQIALAEAATAAGVKPEDFDGSTRWVSSEKFEAFLASARAHMPDDDTFMTACVHRFSESYGPIRFIFWALSPLDICTTVVRHSKLVTRIGKFTTLEQGRTLFHVQYRSEKAESRLACLLRQAQWASGPTMWGLPAARLTESSCIAHGDECCEYRLRWYERRRLLPIFVGIGVGLALALVLGHLSMTVPLAVLPLLGAALGYVVELHRTNSANVAVGHEISSRLRELIQDETEARIELTAINERQTEWSRLMEEQIHERSAVIDRVVGGLEDLQLSRMTRLRGFSHDLRNPLFVLKGNASFLQDRIETGEESEAVKDMVVASQQIEDMLTMLMELANAESEPAKLRPVLIDVPRLTDTLRRRLRALVHGRDIKSTVFATREAPDRVEVDQLVFDRVIDNLLTNAAKYTKRGSIILEIGGTPAQNSNSEFLTLKLSDTGSGMDPTDLQSALRPRSPTSKATTRMSYGVGLSSAIQLLAQIGGRLDVMSKPGRGTTFWAHFPITAKQSTSTPPLHADIESVIQKVVTIRRAEGA